MTEQSEGERLYILGHPVAHSKSPVMYNALYERLGLPWTYALADYAELDEARAFLDARDFLSVNITTPYKPLAFQAATRKAASAQLAQGANVLVRKDDQLIGFNTDGDGCVKFLELAGVTFKGKRFMRALSPVPMCCCCSRATRSAREACWMPILNVSAGWPTPPSISPP